ncbi:AbrB/MazE/SpoVT family DNA-binding domain-containing protein [Candidatus Bathyarchaeota archaeon]|nr:AbrB/MazE/SpoVT family DNA-binding domain-containing protein [Candidatus Bathyarchaeota archaeon]
MNEISILTTSKISAGFRITIPKEVRDLLLLEEGDEIVFFKVSGKVGRVCFRKG